MKHYIKVITAMLIWGSLPVFVGQIKSLSSVEIALSRVIIALITLFIVLLIKGQKLPFDKIKKHILKLLIAGICMGLNWVFLFESYRYVDSGISTLLYYLSPIIFMVASIFIYKEKISASGVFAITLAMCGMIVTTTAATGGSDVPKGVMFGILSAVFYASVIVFNKSMKELDGLTVTIFQLVGAFIALCPYAIAVHKGPLPQLSVKETVFIFILGIFHSGVALLFYFSSIPHIQTQSLAVLSYIDPVSSIFFVTFILGEKLTVSKIIGAVLIIGGAMLGELWGKKKRDV